VRSLFDEFKTFLLRGNAIELAVGIVIGVAFNGIVNSLVADMFMPVIGLITGGFDVSQLTFTLYKDAVLKYGSFLQSIINFLIIGFCMFLVVKGMNRLRHHLVVEEAKKPTEPTATEKLLAEIRDLLREQRAGSEGVRG
jgi:large conductance mechanosensitive channel